MSVENVLQNVQRYLPAKIAWLQNSSILLNPDNRIANTEFLNFQDFVGQLGQTVTFDKAPRAVLQTSLVVSTQRSVQRVQSLSVTQVAQSNSQFNAQEFIFNDIDTYMSKFGMARVKVIATAVETNMLLQIVSAVEVNDQQAENKGSIVDPTSGPYRAFTNGWAPGIAAIPPLSNVTQLAISRQEFRNYGASNVDTCCILPDTVAPLVVGDALNQFVERRNEQYAATWKIGNQGDCDYYQSNLLPTHQAGNVAGATILTLVSANTVNGQTSSITFSGAANNDPNAIKRGDIIQFRLADSQGGNSFRYLRWIAYGLSQVTVQVRALEDVESNGAGQVIIPIHPTLISTSADSNRNVPEDVFVGQQVGVVPSHIAGVLMSGRPYYIAMPMLPDQNPYSTARARDDQTGIAMRTYYGARPFDNQHIYVDDLIYGSTLIDENSMRICIPTAL